MIEIDEDDYVLGMWLCPSFANDMDWMGLAYLRDGELRLDYRFRYYDPASVDPFDGKDDKSWFTIGFGNADEQDVFRAVDIILDQLRSSGLFSGVDFTVVRGTWDDLSKAVSTKGYLHFRDDGEVDRAEVEVEEM